MEALTEEQLREVQESFIDYWLRNHAKRGVDRATPLGMIKLEYKVWQMYRDGYVDGRFKQHLT